MGQQMGRTDASLFLCCFQSSAIIVMSLGLNLNKTKQKYSKWENVDRFTSIKCA